MWCKTELKFRSEGKVLWPSQSIFPRAATALSRRVSVFRRRGGASRSCDRACAVPPAGAAGAGLRAHRAHHYAAGRPLTSFCACELRSPAPFTEQGFRAFNEVYVVTLEKWRPVRRQGEPGCAQQCVSGDRSAGGAVLSRLLLHRRRRRCGARLRDCRQRRGQGRRRKLQRAHHPARRNQRRSDARKGAPRSGRDGAAAGGVGFGWADTTATQVYTVHDLHPFLADEIVRRGAARSGLTWHYASPPVRELEYEMDCRAVGLERVL